MHGAKCIITVRCIDFCLARLCTISPAASLPSPALLCVTSPPTMIPRSLVINEDTWELACKGIKNPDEIVLFHSRDWREAIGSWSSFPLA